MIERCPHCERKLPDDLLHAQKMAKEFHPIIRQIHRDYEFEMYLRHELHFAKMMHRDDGSEETN